MSLSDEFYYEITINSWVGLIKYSINISLDLIWGSSALIYDRIPLDCLIN